MLFTLVMSLNPTTYYSLLIHYSCSEHTHSAGYLEPQVNKAANSNTAIIYNRAIINQIKQAGYITLYHLPLPVLVDSVLPDIMQYYTYHLYVIISNTTLLRKEPIILPVR